MSQEMITMTIFLRKGNNKELLDGLRSVLEEKITATEDKSVLFAAAEHANCLPANELAKEVICADPAAFRSWKNQIIDGYILLVTEVLESFTNRDVNMFSLGELSYYVTGGMSNGDSPSETYDIWDSFFNHEYNIWEETDVLDPFRKVLVDSISFWPVFTYNAQGKLKEQ